MFLLVLCYICIFIQGVLSYGTAYRLTRNGGDNGVSLFGWFLLLGFAGCVPGLGIYLWFRYRDLGEAAKYSPAPPPSVTYSPTPVKTPVPYYDRSSGGWVCKNCRTKNESTSLSCKDCGKYR